MCGKNKNLYFTLAMLIVFLSPQLLAVTVQELSDQIGRTAEKLTIIDVRNLRAYQKSHIPGSINVPALIMRDKKLPPLGNVVIYGDGIHTESVDNAVIALNQKNGIQADILEGGLAAWQSFKLPSSRKAGMKKVRFQYIDYSELLNQTSENADIVLVDLRLTKTREILTDLTQYFPDIEVIKLLRHDNSKKVKFHLKSVLKHRKDQSPPLFILIGNSDALTEKIYKRLGAGGILRRAILTGGELILKRQGQSGQKQVVLNADGEGQ